MKTAVIYTGAMRSFARCLPTHHWHFIRHLGPDVDFFVSTYKDGTEHEADELVMRYPNSRVEIEVIAEQPDCVAEMRAKGVSLPAEWVKGKPYTHEPHAITVHPQAVLRQLWQLQKGWELMERIGNTKPMVSGPVTAGELVTADRIVRVPDYERVVRVRPDIWFQSSSPRWFSTAYATVARTPFWGRFGGCNDRFAVMGATAAEGYFHAYEKTPRLMKAGCPLHPESLVLEAMEGMLVYQDLPVEFATMRKDGSMREPEISVSDLAHISTEAIR